MSFAEAVIVAVVVALGTYLSRAGMILLLAGRTLPVPVVRALRNVGPAVLAALVITFIASADEPYRGVIVPEAAALAVSIGVHYRLRNLLVTLVLGMATFWLTRAVL